MKLQIILGTFILLVGVRGDPKLEELSHSIKEINETLTKENQLLKKENAEMREELYTLKQMMTKSSVESMQRRFVPSHPVVAFHAVRSDNLVLTYDHQAATYDTIITNVGNGFNQYSGRFTAPVKGIYLFTATTQSLSNSQIVQMNIVKNGQVVAYSWSNRSGTTSAILSLNVNDWVEYERFTGIMTQKYTLRGAYQSSISGVLISQL